MHQCLFSLCLTCIFKALPQMLNMFFNLERIVLVAIGQGLLNNSSQYITMHEDSLYAF